MASSNLDVFMPVIILTVMGIVATFGAYIASYFLAPSNPTDLKQTPYECGELPTGSAWTAFNVRFYVVGLIFIIFDHFLCFFHRSSSETRHKTGKQCRSHVPTAAMLRYPCQPG